METMGFESTGSLVLEAAESERDRLRPRVQALGVEKEAERVGWPNPSVVSYKH